MEFTIGTSDEPPDRTLWRSSVARKRREREDETEPAEPTAFDSSNPVRHVISSGEIDGDGKQPEPILATTKIG